MFPLRFDAVFDVGFVSREDEHRLSEVAYHFVFNGPTRDEEQTMAELSPPPERPIPWALVGYPTARRLELAEQLTEELDPGGFVFMPGKPGRTNPDGSLQWPEPLARHEKMSASGLAAVLSSSSYYVWTSAHDFPHYESFRFVAALRSGAVPCKIARDDTSQAFRRCLGSSHPSKPSARRYERKALHRNTGWPGITTCRRVLCPLTCRRR